MRVVVIAMSVCLAAVALADAADAEAAIRLPTTIPAQSLDSALRTLAQEREFHVVYLPEVVNSLRTQGASGVFTRDEALTQLLSGTGLIFRYLDDDTVTIVPAPQSTSKAEHIQGTNARNSSWRSKVAQAQQDTPSSASAVEGSASQETDQDSSTNPERQQIHEIVVTGSRLAASDVSAQPVKVLDRDYIEKSGLTSVSEIIGTLPEVSVLAPESDMAGGAGTVRLRGLPLGSTLVLLNGRSLGSSGLQAAFGGFFDLNNIPAAAVERIEVLPSSSSAIYGGEALAGVVNIILKQDSKGVGAVASYGAADDTHERQATMSFGHVWGNASFSILGTYLERNALRGAEREMTADQDYRRYGGSDFRREMANPGNVYSTNGANLPGLSAAFAALPDSNAVLTPEDLQATAGTLNRSSSPTRALALYPNAERYSFLMMADYRFTEHIEAFSEVLYSSTRQATYGFPFALNRVRVPAANPFNPFAQDVLVSYEFTDTPGSIYETEYIRPLIGVRGQITPSWSWETAAWLTNEETNQALWLLNLPAVNAALASTDPAQAFNPFAAGPGGALRFARPQPQDFTTEASNVDAFLRGSLLEQARFSINAVIGAEASRTTYDRTGTAPVVGDRDTYAFFGEARMPIRAARGGTVEEIITLSAAVRYDNYSDFGSVVTPQLGFVWMPVRGLSITSSYSETFKPPTLFNLFQPRSTVQAPVIDPRRGNESTTVELVRGGNRELDPQTGEGWTVGMAFSPASSEGVQGSLTYWDMKLRDSVGGGGPQLFVDHEAMLADRVLRAQATPEDVAAGRPGRILTIDGTWLNEGTFRLSGVDASVSTRVSTKAGSLSPSLSISNVHRYEGTVAPFAAPTNRVSVHDESGFAPRWKGNASLAWERGPWSASLIGRYTGKYKFQGDSIGDFWYLDSHLSCDLASLLESLHGLSGLRLSVGVVNALGKEPDFAGGSRGYDLSQYDIRGRYWRAQLTADW